MDATADLAASAPAAPAIPTVAQPSAAPAPALAPPSRLSPTLLVLTSAVVSAILSVAITVPLVEYRAAAKPVEVEAPIVVLDTLAITTRTLQDPAVAGDKGSVAVTRIKEALGTLTQKGYIVLRQEAVLAAPDEYMIPRPQPIDPVGDLTVMQDRSRGPAEPTQDAASAP